MSKYTENDYDLDNLGKGKKKRKDWKAKRHLENRKQGKSDNEPSEKEHEFDGEREWDRDHSGSW